MILILDRVPRDAECTTVVTWMNTDDKILTCRRDLASSPELWQANLLEPRKLVNFARDRGVQIFSMGTIERLWQIGLLRADLITSKRPIKASLLDHVGCSDDVLNIYLDARKPKLRPKGYGGSFAKRPPRKDIDLHFHPFRFYVLYHIHRVFEIRASSTQYLLYPKGFQSVTKRCLESLDRWTSDQKFGEVFDKWNLTAEAAIMFDPVAYSKVCRQVRWRLSKETIKKKRECYRQMLESLVVEPDIDRLEQFRMDLTTNAEMLDDNKVLHVLIRLTTWHDRQNVKSALGGCMLLLSMAELIRRGMEDALGREFPEEDELVH